MRLRINQIIVKLEYTPEDVMLAIVRRLGVPEKDLSDVEVLRRSIDARKEDRPPLYVLSVEVSYAGETHPALAPGQIDLVEERRPRPDTVAVRPTAQRPLIIGAGPAGLMATLTLAEAGYRPLLVERGAQTDVRQSQVEQFWQQALINSESNVLFGEGGAGLFSDGKLTARSKDRASIRHFFETLVACGASPDILIDAEPHIGSDVLAEVIPALRQRIIDAGGEVQFDSRLDDVLIEDGTLRGVVISGNEHRTDHCFLATGHSARDVYRMLHRNGVPLEAKPFAIGVRLEMPQRRIDWAQYGRWSLESATRPASYRLTWKGGPDNRGCYTFCMCPGGLVMACASSEGLLTTNGMSFSGRAKPFGNAGFLVPVGISDFPASEGVHPALSGIAFQEAYEKATFEAGGSDYSLPAQMLPEFLAGDNSLNIPAERSCRRAVAANLDTLLPPVVVSVLRRAIPRMLRELNDVRQEEILVYAAETRSSSPVRIVRNPMTWESLGVRGLYPLGEGSGYTGGIVSSALDGIHAALNWASGDESP
ncbi:FAD-binding protein [Candidatus Bipolaricaulota bacterium]|nr:FAD-binding protein [Candidatus Bipolaricaulota bacterium]